MGTASQDGLSFCRAMVLMQRCWEQHYPWQHLLNKAQRQASAQTFRTNTGMNIYQGKYNPGRSWPSAVSAWAKLGTVAAPSLLTWWLAAPCLGFWVLQEVRGWYLGARRC